MNVDSGIGTASSAHRLPWLATGVTLVLLLGVVAFYCCEYYLSGIHVATGSWFWALRFHLHPAVLVAIVISSACRVAYSTGSGRQPLLLVAAAIMIVAAGVFASVTAPFDTDVSSIGRWFWLPVSFATFPVVMLCADFCFVPRWHSWRVAQCLFEWYYVNPVVTCLLAPFGFFVGAYII